MPTKPKNRVPLLGSERVPLPGARASGKVDPDERIRVTVILQSPRQSPQEPSVVSDLGSRMPEERSYPTREEFEATQGAAPDDLAKVEAFAQQYALDIVEESPAKRSVILSGTV